MAGLLPSVGDLTFKSGSIILSWSAPFSLDVTGVDPDIWYSVLIYNVTDNLTAIPCTDCTDITETHYTFTPDYPSPCHKYIFTVIPLNGAGQGHSSGNVTALMSKIQNQCHEQPFCVLHVLPHAEPSPNITVGSGVFIEYDGENYIATVNFLVSHHNFYRHYLSEEHFTSLPLLLLFLLFRETLGTCVPTHSESWKQMSHSAVTYSFQMEL